MPKYLFVANYSPEGIQGVQIMDSGQARITSRRGRNHLMRVLSEIRGNQYHDIDGGWGDF